MAVDVGSAVLIPDDQLHNEAAAIRCRMAREAVDAILADLCDRRGLRHEWDGIDPDTQKHIGEVWERLVAGAGMELPDTAAPARREEGKE
jgi:hypothetical protein